MNRTTTALLGALVGANLLASPVLADEFDASMCASEPMSADGEAAEDIAAFMQVIGAPMNMHVKVFQSVEDLDTKFIVAADPFYGVIVNMHNGNQICTMAPEDAAAVFENGAVFEVQINPQEQTL